MEKRILFCNVAWMKNYRGVTDDDRPHNGGKYIDDIGSGGEVYNFSDENGKCYGYVMPGGQLALQDHYKGVKSSDSYVDDVLVVWIATNKNKETRIIGWYKNARVYRSFQNVPSFTNGNFHLYYNIVVDSVDAILLPVEDRTFPIDRAKEVGKGRGIGQSNIWYADKGFAKANIVPSVFQYIENYEGKRSNFIYLDEEVEKDINKIEFLDDYGKLYEEGLKYYEKGEYYNALVYFKAAIRVNEKLDALYKLGESLFLKTRYDEAIEIFNRIIELEGEKIDSLDILMRSYDLNRNKERTIEYANKIIEFPNDLPEYMESKIIAYCIIFDIYMYEKKYKIAEKTMNNLEKYLKNVAKYSQQDQDRIIKQMKNILKEGVEGLIIQKK